MPAETATQFCAGNLWRLSVQQESPGLWAINTVSGPECQSGRKSPRWPPLDRRHFGKSRQADHLTLAVQDQTGQHGENPFLLKIQNLARHGAGKSWTKALAGLMRATLCFQDGILNAASSEKEECCVLTWQTAEECGGPCITTLHEQHFLLSSELRHELRLFMGKESRVNGKRADPSCLDPPPSLCLLPKRPKQPPDFPAPLTSA
ncbi:hypothetical protein AAY473_010881 [Plecturocebus cupreus]